MNKLQTHLDICISAPKSKLSVFKYHLEQYQNHERSFTPISKPENLKNELHAKENSRSKTLPLLTILSLYLLCYCAVITFIFTHTLT